MPALPARLYERRYTDPHHRRRGKMMHSPFLRIIFSGALILAAKVLDTHAFTSHSERLMYPQQGRRGHGYYREAPTRLPTEAFTLGSRLPATSSDDNEDDDGWGVPSSKSDQERELAALQAERAGRSAPGSSASSNKVQQNNEPPERDLFIPIFALVSLAGLFGSYGYELLRLYSRGELYLPWDQ